MKNTPTPPTYLLVLLLLSIGSHFLFPIVTLITTPYNYLGLALLLFGIILNLWTDALFKKAQTTVKPDKEPNTFITSGPFKISRHPMYLGMVTILLGIAVLLGSLSTFLPPILFILIMEKKFIPMEEANMEKAFYNEYLEYKNRVQKWF